jgi:3-phosphoshikimate 1-carboxyvinyltransferase
MTTDLVVTPLSGALKGSVPVASDKSIGHRALLFSAIANGKSRIRAVAYGEDNKSTAAALGKMGITIESPSPAEIIVHGAGLFGLRAPDGPLDCGNSGTTMRLLCGLLCAQPFESVLIGDASLSRRPMMRVAKPLRARGARVEGQPHAKKEGEITAPLRIGPLPENEHLKGLEYDSPVASAQVKSAILLSGLYAHGETIVREPQISRDHTERMMHALGVPIRTLGTMVAIDPAGWSGEMPALDVEVPGDISAAAFMLVAGAICEGSHVTVRGVGTNPTRTGILDILRDMGANVSASALGDRSGEPVSDVTVLASQLYGRKLGGEVVTRAIDEIPIVCALAARAKGTTEIMDAEELRVKESDRIGTMAGVLRAFGVECEERPDGMVIEGRAGGLKAAEIESKDDHRIAMTATVLGLLADGPTTVRDVECIATSFPKFIGTLRALGATLEARVRA